VQFPAQRLDRKGGEKEMPDDYDAEDYWSEFEDYEPP
jgi:hypothetical protein